MREHEFAAVFPLLEGEALEELTKDIAANGQMVPILVFEGAILDGRNRYRACCAVGVTPITEQARVKDRESALRLVISLNIKRRHLSEAQRGMAALSVLPMFEALAAERQRATLAKPGEQAHLRASAPVHTPKPTAALMPDGRSPLDYVAGSYGVPARDLAAARRAADDAAKAFGVSARTIANAKKVQEQGVPELAQAVRSGLIGAKPAAALVRKSAEVQREVVRQITEDNARPADAVREAIRPVVFSSASDAWYTPDPVLAAARAVLGSIDLDPASCAEANEVVGADRYYTEDDDGLAQRWTGRVWLNPPYGRDAARRSNQEKWSRYLLDSYEAGDVTSALLLVTFCPDRSWFEPLWKHPMCAFSSRLKFRQPHAVGLAGLAADLDDPDSDASGPSGPVDANVCVYLGPDVDAFERAFCQFGVILVPAGRVIEVRQ